MFTFRVDSSGLISRINQMGSEFNRKKRKVVEDVSKAGMNEAIRNTPVDTGHLRRSWQLQPIREEGSRTVAGYGNNVKYLYAVNYGWQSYGKGRWNPGYYMIEKGDQALRVMSQKAMKKFLREIVRG